MTRGFSGTGEFTDMRGLSTVLKIALGFAAGYAFATLPEEKMRPALRQVVRAGAAVQSKINEAISTAAEELAKIRAEDLARRDSGDRVASTVPEGAPSARTH
jgi:hypothetical protein